MTLIGADRKVRIKPGRIRGAFIAGGGGGAATHIGRSLHGLFNDIVSGGCKRPAPLLPIDPEGPRVLEDDTLAAGMPPLGREGSLLPKGGLLLAS